MIKAEADKIRNTTTRRIEDGIQNCAIRNVANEIEIVRPAGANEKDHSFVSEKRRKGDWFTFLLRNYH